MDRKTHKRLRKANTPSLHSDFLFEDWSDRFEQQLTSDGSFSSLYLKSEWKSKLRDPSQMSDRERRSNAIVKWLKTEERNARTNVRLYCSPTRFWFGDSDSILEEASRLIRTIIGDEPPKDLLSLGSFTDGASTSVKRGVGTIGRKFESGGHVTASCLPLMKEFISGSPFWSEIRTSYTLVEGNVLFTVPKSSTIDRCAAKEPDLNMWVQKSIGSFFRTRLFERARVNLNDQTINQRLARQGSSDGSLATVDLSSASDSVTVQLVNRLLPIDWFVLMDRARSPLTFIPDGMGESGIWHTNEMFSSMGNAFTFELESLIFWALAKVLASHLRIRGRISVYGDDIICPSSLVLPLTDLFGYCGLLVNSKKSHWTGGFRESCGKHYYYGSDISPFYVKEIPTTVTQVIHLANRLRGWLEKSSVLGCLDSDYYLLWSELKELIPAPLIGSCDLERVDALVAHGRRNLAVLRQSSSRYRWYRRSSSGELRCTQELASGCYLHWLSQASRDIVAECSDLVIPGPIALRRLSRDNYYAFGRQVSWFSEELN